MLALILWFKKNVQNDRFLTPDGKLIYFNHMYTEF